MFKTIRLVEGYSVTLDTEVGASRCRSCGKDIHWAVTHSVKNMPISKDPQGQWHNHFKLCGLTGVFKKHSRDDRLSELLRQEKRNEW